MIADYILFFFFLTEIRIHEMYIGKTYQSLSGVVLYVDQSSRSRVSFLINYDKYKGKLWCANVHVEILQMNKLRTRESECVKVY